MKKELIKLLWELLLLGLLIALSFAVIDLYEKQKDNENRFRVIADRLYLDMTEKELKEIEK